MRTTVAMKSGNDVGRDGSTSIVLVVKCARGDLDASFVTSVGASPDKVKAPAEPLLVHVETDAPFDAPPTARGAASSHTASPKPARTDAS
jgi:hypothetical protein